MTADRFEVRRLIAAEPSVIFQVLTDPRAHVAIDSSGMLMAATGEPVSAVGDSFVVHMDREALSDRPLGQYDVVVTITAFEPDREIAWDIRGTSRPPLGHRYGYQLEAAEGGTLVTSYYDWSDISAETRQAGVFPVIPEATLRSTLGILDRTLTR